jgi:hypothetical protein
MDWNNWAKQAQLVLDTGRDRKYPAGLLTLFAASAVYRTALYPELLLPGEVLDHLVKDVPDWTVEIVSIHGDETGAGMEWIGRGHLMRVFSLTLHGASVIEIDSVGKVQRWIDYVDRREWDAALRVGS